MDNHRPLGSNKTSITRQCTAKSKRSGEQCRKPAMKGRTVCLAHGGRTPRGVASPNFTTGRYSRSLPGYLVADYKRAMHDLKLLSLRDELALTDAKIGGLLGQLDDKVSAAKDRRIFRQVARLIELRRRLVDSEVRHIVLAREMMTAEQAIAMVMAITDIVKRYLPDAKDRQAIAEEIYALISQQGTNCDA